MKERLVASTRARLQAQMSRFVQEQEDSRLANDELSRISRAEKKLGDGWSVTGVRTAMGRKAPKRPDQLPQCSALLRFCQKADVNAEWLFTGEGAERRSQLQAGATMGTARVAAELCAHVLPRCAELYEVAPGDLEVDAERVLEMAVSALLTAVRSDAARYHQVRTERHALRFLQDAQDELVLRFDVEEIENPVVEAGRVLKDQLDRNNLFTPSVAIHPNIYRALEPNPLDDFDVE